MGRRVTPRIGRVAKVMRDNEPLLQWRRREDLAVGRPDNALPIWHGLLVPVSRRLGSEAEGGVTTLEHPAHLTLRPAYVNGELLDIKKGDLFYRLKYIGVQREGEPLSEFEARVCQSPIYFLTVHSFEEQLNEFRILGNLEG